ncbi:hypothetical protein RRG08_016176 [Elysia crispata]|uniref:Sulfotransferase domain-containing protein n=1 Tax=Elysia crispata TaxID=231223 RepID=A0AAE1DJS0_9GAST|nr:hypothetical protein RRG08_016176 [Elysia crispata]
MVSLTAQPAVDVEARLVLVLCDQTLPFLLTMCLWSTVDCGDYYQYHLDWQRVIKDNPGHPILVVKYEDSVQDLARSIRAIAAFLERPLTEQQVQDVAEALSFPNMKRHFKDTVTEKLIRKGDWKNWLTHGESDQLDMKCKQLSGSQFEPQFEL